MAQESKQKLWGGRFSKGSAVLLDRFNASIPFDYKLWKYDINGSLAHSFMLHKIGILDSDELESIHQGLKQIALEIENGEFEFKLEDEDIHMAIESALINKIGDVGKKLHTARSRNDQVALDFRLYVKDKIKGLQGRIIELMSVLLDLASRHTESIMPGMTHLQHAQPINFGFHLVCWSENLRRDFKRLQSSYERNDYLPLGVGALAGTPYGNDREFLAKTLGFSAPTLNAMDSVSDRDFALDLLYDIAMLLMHISRFAEELVLWSTCEFGFVSISDSYATGSSIMPQKKNPDVPELLRAKSGRAYGNLISLLTTMKALPFAYNKDTQEDKEVVFNSVENAEISLEILKEVMQTLKINTRAMEQAAKKGHLCATDLADYLVREAKIPFREAHHITGQIVAMAEEKGCDISELSLDEVMSFNDRIKVDVLEVLSLKNSMNARTSLGGTASKNTKDQIEYLKEWIKNVRN